MKKEYLFFFYVVLLFDFALSQEATESILDSDYLEDQFYFGIGYNILSDLPAEVVQQNFSYNLQFGFIKDIPLTKQRNFGLGIGVGYMANSYYSNVLAEEIDGGVTYRILEGNEFKRSKIGTHAIEFPLELRWRTSTPESHKFWRIYGGIKVNYNFSAISKTVLETSDQSFSNPDIRKWESGFMLNLGYNTFNFHAYYGLKPVLKETALINEERINLRTIRIGIMFYIL